MTNSIQLIAALSDFGLTVSAPWGDDGRQYVRMPKLGNMDKTSKVYVKGHKIIAYFGKGGSSDDFDRAIKSIRSIGVVVITATAHKDSNHANFEITL